MKIPAALRFLKTFLRTEKYFNPGVRIFSCHRVKPISAQDRFYERAVKFPICIDPLEFEGKIKAINSKYRIISFRDFLDGRAPRNAAILTFDDGYKDFYINAYPILKKHGIPASVFLVVDFIGTDRMFWWDKLTNIIFSAKSGSFDSCDINDEKEKEELLLRTLKKMKSFEDAQKTDYLNMMEEELSGEGGIGDNLNWDDVREMRGNGISFESHSMSHLALTQVSLQKAKEEILNSKTRIEQETKKKVSVFCYPHGAYNEMLKDIVKGSGYDCAVTVRNRISSLNDDLFELGRIRLEDAIV